MYLVNLYVLNGFCNYYYLIRENYVIIMIYSIAGGIIDGVY